MEEALGPKTAMQDSSTSSLSDIKTLSRSPSITTDLGYHTWVTYSTQPTTNNHCGFSLNQGGISMRELSSHATPSTSNASTSTSKPSIKANAINYFDKLTDDLVIKIFGYLTTNELCSSCARVCRRWYYLAWEPTLWQKVVINSHQLSIDRGLKTVVRLLSRDFYCRERTASLEQDPHYLSYSSTDTSVNNGNSLKKYANLMLPIERLILNGCSRLTDKSLLLIGRKCADRVRCIEIRGCVGVTAIGLKSLLANCINLEKLDLTGCSNIVLNTIQHSNHPSKLHYLDLSSSNIDDYGLKTFLKFYGHQLTHLYLRRCSLLTDHAVKCITTYCPLIRELSLTDCLQLTDFVCFELSSELGSNLRYLSLAKCEQISDGGIKQIARHCRKLRYLNIRGCETISDEGLVLLARSCRTRLKALDIGKCDVTDQGLKVLSESCPNLRKLSVRDCELVSDIGTMSIAYYCQNLTLLNIANCQHVTINAYRYIKRVCKQCTIQHSNPTFF